MVERKKPRNSAVGPGVTARLVHEKVHEDRDAHTWSVGPMTVRRVGDPVPPSSAGAPPTVKHTGAPGPPLAPVSIRQNACPRCGQVATERQYVDRVTVGGVVTLRHVVCPVAEIFRPCHPPIAVGIEQEGAPLGCLAVGWRGTEVLVRWSFANGDVREGWFDAALVKRL